jgi:DNA-binding transcriptional MerR regulator
VRPTFWKVGELARRTGVSVRTLHYYDEIGLLSPSHHTGSGHRLYAARDVVRLQQVLSLRQLGFALEEIRDCLGRGTLSLREVLQMHLARLREQIQAQQQLCRRLEALASGLASAEEVSVEDFLGAIEGLTMIEKYYTPEQMEYLRQRGEQVGEERIRQVEAEWQQLIAQVRAERDAGTDPADERVQELARRWIGLVQEFTGGDPGIEKSLRTMWHQEENIHGLDTREMRELRAYIDKALAAAKK